MLLSRKFLSFLGMAMLAMSLFSCAGVNSRVPQITAERPKDEAFRTELNRNLSSLNIVIEATAKELGDNLNRIIPRELYKGSVKGSELNADILRNGPIAVSATGNFIYLNIPISMSISYNMFETPAIATNLKFKLNARVTPDWKISTDVYFTGLSDVLAAEVGIGPVSIQPRNIVDGITQPLQRTLSDLINRKLNEKFSLRDRVAEVWDEARKPLLLDNNYNAWLMITPRELYLYPLYAQNNLIRVGVGLKSFAELVVGPEPVARAPLPLPDLKAAEGSDRSFRVSLNSDLYYKDILNIASPLLLNRELGSDGKSVIIKKLDLYGNGDRLIVRMETSGSLDGTFYLTCRPAFDPRTNVFSVDDVDFDIETRSLLLRTADWFLHGSIRNTIRDRLNVDLSKRLAQARDMAGKALARVNLASNAYLTGNVKTMKLNDVMVRRDKISIQLYTEGEAAIFFH